MKIGILKCDTPAGEYIHIAGDYDQMFIDLFSPWEDEIEFLSYDIVNEEYPANLDDIDGYVSTGSKFSVYDDVKWIHKFERFVKKLYLNKQKFVGICFGHQMIAHALGGRVELTDRGWGVGKKKAKIYDKKIWMNPELSEYELLLSHQDQVTVLPKESTLLAGNNHCPNSMYLVGNSFLSMQAHPEFNFAYAKALILSRRERIGESIILPALETFKDVMHRQEIASWIVNFLKV